MALGTIAESATELSDEEHHGNDQDPYDTYYIETAGESIRASTSGRVSRRDSGRGLGEGMRDSMDGTLTPRSELELRDRVGAWLASGMSSLSSLGAQRLPSPFYTFSTPS